MSKQERKVRLLLVDDDEEFLVATARVLQRRGIEVFTAITGVKALQLLETEQVDVVVLDVKMPGMQGTEVFSQLQKEKGELAVIMLTGHGTIPQAVDLSKKGVFDYLAKPCDVDVLVGRIQAAAEQTTANRAAGRAGEPDFPSLGERVRLLIVDDEVEFLETLTKVMQRRGMEVLTAETGAEALDVLGKNHVDVVVLDVKMPGIMDGLETLQRIKRDHPDREVILLTGHPTVAAAKEGIKQGAFEYIEKPPKMEELTDLIRKAFKKRQERLRQRQQEIIRDVLRRYPC